MSSCRVVLFRTEFNETAVGISLQHPRIWVTTILQC